VNAEPQRQLILHMSVSLDGFVARKDGVVDWLGTGEQQGATRHHANLEMIGQVGLIVIGRGAYEDGARRSRSPAGSPASSRSCCGAPPSAAGTSSLSRPSWKGSPGRSRRLRWLMTGRQRVDSARDGSCAWPRTA